MQQRSARTRRPTPSTHHQQSGWISVASCNAASCFWSGQPALQYLVTHTFTYTHTHTLRRRRDWGENMHPPHQCGMLIDVSQSGCRVTLIFNTTLKVERSPGRLFMVIIWNVGGSISNSTQCYYCNNVQAFCSEINQFIFWLMRFEHDRGHFQGPLSSAASSLPTSDHWNGSDYSNNILILSTGAAHTIISCAKLMGN